MPAPPTDQAPPEATSSWRAPVTHRNLRIDIRPGTGSGPPLLMFSGIGVSYESFDRLVRCLDPSIEIIRIDVPGVGGSPADVLPRGIPRLARLIAGVLDDLGYGQVDVLGFSWGGAVAQQFAFQHRGRCRRMVLISTSMGVLGVPGRPGALSTMLNPRSLRNPRHAALMLAKRHSATSDGNVRRMLGRTQVAGLSRGYLYQIAALSWWSSLPFLRLIRQPVLIIAGDDDQIVPIANGRVLAALLPHSTLHVFAGGHVDPLATPAEFAPIISDFLA